MRMSDAQFEDVMADALDEIPQDLFDSLDNVVIEHVHEPTPVQRANACGHDSAGVELLGLYVGVPLTRRGPSYGTVGVAPDHIYIFSGPIRRVSGDEEQVRARIRQVVLHEVGHYFGLSDARLHELGY